MKKTFATMALGVALAASASAVSLEDAVLSVPSYDGTDSYTDTFSTMSGSRALTTMTLVFDWEALQALDFTTATNAVLLTQGSEGQTGLGFKLDNNNITAYTWGDTGIRSNHLSVASYVVSGKVALTLATRPGNAGTRLYALNEAGATGQYTSDGGLRWTLSTGFDTLTVNTDLASALDSIYVFNSELSESDVISVAQAAVAAAVPEPATATLSLLALAGLAARRRRK